MCVGGGGMVHAYCGEHGQCVDLLEDVRKRSRIGEYFTQPYPLQAAPSTGSLSYCVVLQTTAVWGTFLQSSLDSCVFLIIIFDHVFMCSVFCIVKKRNSGYFLPTRRGH